MGGLPIWESVGALLVTGCRRPACGGDLGGSLFFCPFKGHVTERTTALSVGEVITSATDVEPGHVDSYRDNLSEQLR